MSHSTLFFTKIKLLFYTDIINSNYAVLIVVFKVITTNWNPIPGTWYWFIAHLVLVLALLIMYLVLHTTYLVCTSVYVLVPRYLIPVININMKSTTCEYQYCCLPAAVCSLAFVCTPTLAYAPRTSSVVPLCIALCCNLVGRWLNTLAIVVALKVNTLSIPGSSFDTWYVLFLTR